MFADIARVSLAAGSALFPDQPWSDFGVASQPQAASKSPIEQLGLIENLLPTLAQALAQIERSPLTAAATQTRAVLPAQARRVTPAAWMTHARLGQRRRTVDETVAVSSHDTPENRAVKSFLEVLERDSRFIAQVADAEEEAEVSARAMQCIRRLRRLPGALWWESVTPKRSDWTWQATLRETARPEYAQIVSARGQYRKSFGFEWDQPLLTLPPRETWRLYEVWCLFTVLQALRELGWEAAPPQDLFAVRAGRLELALAVGEKSRMSLRRASGQELSLTYNQTFAEGGESLTHSMQPDITLSDGERVWILDAKFKPYSGPGEEGGDINQMHAYRDAIIGLSGTSIVAAAWCLYVGLTQTSNRAYITYGRSADTAVGALCLRPGGTAALITLQGLLTRWLSPD